MQRVVFLLSATTFLLACDGTTEETFPPLQGDYRGNAGGDSFDPMGDNFIPAGDTHTAGDTRVGGDTFALGDTYFDIGDPGPSTYQPPVGTYILASPVAANQANEDSRLFTNRQFTVEVRVGHIDNLRSFGFTMSWDPAVLGHVSHERVDEWLTSEGGAILAGGEVFDGVGGSLQIAAAIGGTGVAVSTATSEAIYHVTFDWVGATGSTEVTLSLSGGDNGLIQDGAGEPMTGVTVVDLSINP